MPDTDIILNDLTRLAAFPTLALDDAFLDDTLRQFSNEAVLHYVQTMKRGGAPEAATEELLVAAVRDCVGIALTTKLIIGIPGDPNKKIIDYALCEGEDTLAIELKPLFKRTGKTRQTLVPNDLKNADGNLADYREQVTNYLQYAEFVVLSNAREAYFFSRTSAQLQFQPFATRSFADFVRFLAANKANVFDALRRMEAESDTINSNLDTLFFGSLKQWVREFRERVKFSAKEDDPTKKFTRDEAIVLLINKIVFIKTAEDYGLIQFRYLVSAYKQQRGFWLGKRNAKIFEDFFRQVEDYFEIYYNTDLFAEHFWHYVEQSPANIESFRRVFEQVLGVDKWDASFGNGLLHYNYRQIDEDIFGKAYETFIAEERKDSGIFYTPVPLAKYMTRQTVGELMRPLVDEIIVALDKNNPDVTRAEALLAELQQIRLIDTTSGSGSFLIKILRDVFAEYDRIEETLAWTRDLAPNVLFSMPDNVRRVSEFRAVVFDNRYAFVSRTVLHHVCAADMDERALETAKTNLWKELLKLPTPNAPQSYHVGTLQKAGRDHILPNLELNFICGDMLIDLPIQTQLDVLRRNHTSEIVRLHELRSTYLDNPFDLAPVEEAKRIRQTLHEHLLGELPEEMRGILRELGRKPVFVCAEFFYAWFGADGEPLSEEKQGFHAVISNPPWEELSPVKKEFAQIGKYSMDRQEFEKHFRQLLKDPDTNKRWELYERFYEFYSAFVREHYVWHDLKPSSSKAMRAHLNLFKLFFERDLQILRPNGKMTLLIPSSFQTDEGSFGLRTLAFKIHRLLEMRSFENRPFKGIRFGKEQMIQFFDDVDSRFKFSIVRIIKTTESAKVPLEITSEIFDGQFYLQNPEELESRPIIPYKFAMVERFSPDSLSIMEFRAVEDYNLCAKIRDEHVLLEQNGFKFRREFNMTDDAALFLPLKGLSPKETTAIAKTHLRLYEGKMIHQFNANFSSANYAVSEEAGRKQLALVEAARIKRQFGLKDKPAAIAEKYFASGLFSLDYEAYRLVYRAVARSTDERTLIAAIAPKRVFAVHSINYLINCFYEQEGETIRQIKRSAVDMLWLMTLLNSLTLNYYIRNKVSANLTMNFLYELPIPAARDGVQRSIAEQGFMLLAANAQGKEFDELGAELGMSGSFAMRGSEEAIMRRAGLEVQIARDVYGLTVEEWQHIVSTFSYGGDSDTKQELDAVIAASLALFAE